MVLAGTIVARATPPGRSLRAIVRLSGPSTRDALRALGVILPTPRAALSAHLALLAGHLPVLIAWMPGPDSYTGEDSAELSLPGNPALVDRLVTLLCGLPGVRAAEPGEFSARAYLHGRLTLDQAEGVAALVAAASDAQLRASRDLLSGRTGAEYRAWADEITTLLALVEAGIDFTDQEDVVPIAPDALARRLAGLRQRMTAFLGGPREARAGRPLVLLVGRPSTGKSTLFNALLGRTRAVTHPDPGTTRDVLVEPLAPAAPGAPEIDLADAPGLDAGDPASHAAAVGAARGADALLWCDPTGTFDPRELPPDLRVPIVRVRTFADRSSTGAGIPVCALDGRNLRTLHDAIERAASHRGDGLGSLLPRHRSAVLRALDALDDAGRESSPELVADALRRGLDAAGELVGVIPPDEVIGRVFATFCVGK